jgi:hypothetical protein
MTIRFWGIMLMLGLLFTAAMIIDQPLLGAIQHMIPDMASIPVSDGGDILHGCISGQGISIGPLVPDQNTAAPTASPREIPLANDVLNRALSTRSGFSLSSPTDPGYWAGMLGSGWYLDWGMQAKKPLDGLEHWQMVRVHDNCITPAPEVIKSTAANYPGQVWIIGNEPDVIWQDNVTPTKYAIDYHELYALIKSADPSARIAVGGISQATPLRLQYLDRVLQAYQGLYHTAMPADWWTVHGYVLREEKGSWGVDIPPGIDATQGELYEVSDHGRIDLFESQLVAFRQWMAARGYQNTPLSLTEFGILMPTSYGFPTVAIADYLQQTFTWLYQAQDSSIGYPGDNDHLVQNWAWFSLSDPTYTSSNLGDLASNRLTMIGERFRNVVQSMEP